MGLYDNVTMLLPLCFLVLCCNSYEYAIKSRILQNDCTRNRNECFKWGVEDIALYNWLTLDKS